MEPQILSFKVIQTLSLITARTLDNTIIWDKRRRFVYKRHGKLVERLCAPKLGIYRPHKPSETDVERYESKKNDPLVVEFRTGTDKKRKFFFLFMYQYWDHSYGCGSAETLFIGNDPDQLRGNVIDWHCPRSRGESKMPETVSVCEGDDSLRILEGAIAKQVGESVRDFLFYLPDDSPAALLRYAAIR